MESSESITKIFIKKSIKNQSYLIFTKPLKDDCSSQDKAAFSF